MPTSALSPASTLEASATPATAAAASLWDTPAEPTLTPNAARRLVESMPEEKFQLIVREAFLFRAGQLVLQAMRKAKVRHEKLCASRPPFFALRRAETRKAFNATLAATSEDQARFARALEGNTYAMKRVREGAEAEIGDWLCRNDATYGAVAAAESLGADWNRCLERLTSKMDEFVRALGHARDLLESAQLDSSGGVTEAGRRAILQASDVGAAVAEAVTAANALADERDRLLRGTMFESKFPRLPAFDLAASLKGAIGLPAKFLHQQFGLILDRANTLRTAGLTASREQVQQVERHYGAARERYFAGVWQALREYAAENGASEQESMESASAAVPTFGQGVFA